MAVGIGHMSVTFSYILCSKTAKSNDFDVIVAAHNAKAQNFRYQRTRTLFLQ